MPEGYADKIEMQNRLFSELSRMFGVEVPLYDKSLLVNSACNRVVCDLAAARHEGFSVSDSQIEKTSGERHGAIRIGRPDEYRLIGRFFACFAMEPHNFYDMTSVGAKSQPVIASAFRSVVNPEHRVFTALLMTDYFDDETRARIEGVLSERRVFSDEAVALIERSESAGGLSWADAEALITEGAERIFRWTGRARDFALYEHLCGAGFKIAADIACFEAHHLNHLTPNTFCMDLYTSAMKYCMGELDEAAFRERAGLALGQLAHEADADWLRLQFKHLTRAEIDAFTDRGASAMDVAGTLERMVGEFSGREFDLRRMEHAGYKDSTEGPTADTPVLLRQDAYRALTEPVTFTNPDGTTVETVHTARFGEIEQRFYATTPEGRALYDACLDRAEALLARDPGLPVRDVQAYRTERESCFGSFPKSLGGLLRAGLVFGWYEPTEAGLAARGDIATTDIFELADLGYVVFEGLRYEDFLPVSAAGIFASNLGEYGTKSTASAKPVYTQAMLEAVLGREIVDADSVYRGLQSESLLRTYADLGLSDRLDDDTLRRLEAEAAALPEGAAARFGERSTVAARA